jgi:hypothetical protein
LFCLSWFEIYFDTDTSWTMPSKTTSPTFVSSPGVQWTYCQYKDIHPPVECFSSGSKIRQQWNTIGKNFDPMIPPKPKEWNFDRFFCQIMRKSWFDEIPFIPIILPFNP